MNCRSQGLPASGSGTPRVTGSCCLLGEEPLLHWVPVAQSQHSSPSSSSLAPRRGQPAMTIFFYFSALLFPVASLCMQQQPSEKVIYLGVKSYKGIGIVLAVLGQKHQDPFLSFPTDSPRGEGRFWQGWCGNRAGVQISIRLQKPQRS